MTVDEYFRGKPESRKLFESVRSVLQAFDEVNMRVTKSQVAFYRRKAFAWAWMPGQYVRGRVSPLVLTLSLPFQDSSPRWKEIVEPRPGRFIHHLELYSPDNIDDQVREWVWIAWTNAS